MNHMNACRKLLQDLRHACIESDIHGDSALIAALAGVPAECKPLFPFQGPQESSRNIVNSRNVVLNGGTLLLDPQDVEEVLTLSSDINMDEILALEYLDLAQSMVGEVSAEAALGMFFEDRATLLELLLEIFKIQACGAASVSNAVYRAVCSCSKQILQQSSSSQATFAGFLLQLLSDTSLEAKSGSRLLKVVTLSNQLQDRHVLVQKEKLLMSECLFYISTISNLTANETASTLDLIHAMGSRMEGLGLKDAATVQQTGLLLAVALQSLSSHERHVSSETQTTESHYASLVKDQDLAGRLEGAELANGLEAITHFAWGVLLDLHGPANYRARSQACINLSLQWGALHCLRAIFFTSHSFEDAALAQSIAEMLNQLCLDFLDSDNYRSCMEQLLARSQEVDDRDELEALGEDLSPSSIFSSQRDGMHSLLLLLADINAAQPQFWLQDQARSEVFSGFMHDAFSDGLLSGSPAILIAYLGILEALARTEPGARAMFSQLQQDKNSPLSWQRMLEAMHQYCRKYASGHQQVHAWEQGRPLEHAVPTRDANAMRAYLRLLTTILKTASKSDFHAFTSDLEQIIQIKPLWSLFLQLMCHPVPQILKAALDDALAAFIRQADDAAAIMSRMLLHVIVQPSAIPAGGSALTVADITLQLHEIEERSEDYCESLAFVRLLNTAYASFGGDLPEHGRIYCHFTEFIKSELLGQAAQRGYRYERQKWELLEASLVHMQLCLRTIQPEFLDEMSIDTPGLVVLTDLWGGHHCWKACSRLVLQGASKIAHDRASNPAGVAKEAAVKAALRLLESAMQIEPTLLAFLNARKLKVHLEPLEALFRDDHRLLLAILGYAQYPYTQAIQTEAIKLAQHLVVRIPNLLDVLQLCKGGKSPAVQLAAGFAECLQAHLGAVHYELQPGRVDHATNESGNPAELTLQLLLYSLRQPAPSLAHLLLGFAVDSGPEGVRRSELNPQLHFSCLTVLLAAVQSMPTSKREFKTSACILEVLLELASNSLTRESILDVVRKVGLLPTQLALLAGTTVSTQDDRSLASLQHTANLLQLCALELHNGEAAIPMHQASLVLILKRLLLPVNEPTGEPDPENLLIALLHLLLQEGQSAPALHKNVSSELRTSMQTLDVQSLLQAALVEVGEPLFPEAVLYNIPKLAHLLQTRLQNASDDQRRFNLQESSDLLRGACMATMLHAQQCNAFVEEKKAIQKALVAWQYVVEVAIHKRFQLLPLVLSSIDQATADYSALSALNNLLETIVGECENLHPGCKHLLPQLAQVIRLVLARLKDCVVDREVAHGLQGVLMPSNLRRVLDAVLSVMQLSSSVDVRLPLYGSVIDLLSICHRSSGGSDPASRLERQTPQMRPELKLSISEAIENSEVLAFLTKDATGLPTNTVARVLALNCLAKLAAMSSSFTDRLFDIGFPHQLLTEMLHLIDKAFVQVRVPARGLLQVILAQAGLLLLIVQTTATSAADPAKLQLSSLKIIPALTQCKALDLQPGQKSFGSETMSDITWSSLNRLLTSLLRLVVASLLSMPQSRSRTESAASFVEMHHRSLLRILKEAGDSNSRFWPPSLPVMEQALLIVQVLGNLGGMEAHILQSASQFQAHIFMLLHTYSSLGIRVAKTPAFPPSNQAVCVYPASQQEQHSLEIRLALTIVLHNLVVRESQGIVLPLTTGRGEYHGPPSLLLLAELLAQVCKDLVWVVREDLPEQEFDEGGLLQSRIASRKVHLLVMTLENILAILLHHVTRHVMNESPNKDMDHFRQTLKSNLKTIEKAGQQIQPAHTAKTASILHFADQLKDCLFT